MNYFLFVSHSKEPRLFNPIIGAHLAHLRLTVLIIRVRYPWLGRYFQLSIFEQMKPWMLLLLGSLIFEALDIKLLSKYPLGILLGGLESWGIWLLNIFRWTLRTVKGFSLHFGGLVPGVIVFLDVSQLLFINRLVVTVYSLSKRHRRGLTVRRLSRIDCSLRHSWWLQQLRLVLG